jgi:TolB-like protein/Tfp pilus assembly protein PilF
MTNAGVYRASSSAPSQEEVQQQLERILSSPEFRLPERARRFLEFVVTETLADRREYLKAFTIAQAVFGRDANFDAQQDPCVRIEAGRLRRELEHYYLTAGGTDRIIITIPLGGYAPVFEVRQGAEPTGMSKPGQSNQPMSEGGAAQQVDVIRDTISRDTIRRDRTSRQLSRPRSWLLTGGVVIVLAAAAALLEHGKLFDTGAETVRGADSRPTIIVERFENAPEGGLASGISRGITDDIIEKLFPFNDIVVVAVLPRSKEGQASSEPLYALQGSVRLEGSILRSTARLVRRADGVVIWANNYDADMKVQGILKTQSSLADHIAAAVARPFGVMFETDTAGIAGNADAFSCTLSYYSYRSEMTAQAHEAAKSCLQRAIEKTPDVSNITAFLSLTHLDEFRFPYQLNTKPTAATLSAAKELAERAVRLDPKNARALQALMLADFFSNDPIGAMRAGEAAYASNPNDTEVAGEYGLRLSMSGKWDMGCELISKAISRNAGPHGYYEVGMALCAFMRGDTQAAELWSRMSDLNYNPMHRLVLLSILGTLGKTAEAKEQLDWIALRSPALIPNVRQEVAKRLARPEDQERFLAGLVAAGLPVSDEKASRD